MKQSRHSNRIRYVLGEDEVQYSLEDGAGRRSLSVPYTQISCYRQSLPGRS
ncbi:hypothetical protein [Pseudoxanthomonas gei]|uniref:hypothetical protein n=1 Tax=Pseudoxanthomonas gei TaxID=1383030 RepID=UPI001390D524|nr:hypothetical protein [Pseudoxanthomonas gei]